LLIETNNWVYSPGVLHPLRTIVLELDWSVMNGVGPNSWIIWSPWNSQSAGWETSITEAVSAQKVSGTGGSHPDLPGIMLLGEWGHLMELHPLLLTYGMQILMNLLGREVAAPSG